MQTYRPDTLEGFIGNEQVKRNLAVALHAAKVRNATVDHMLVTGPAGTGKTTIAKIVAHEMGTRLEMINGAALRGHGGALVATLLSLRRGDVLFIDEIHSMGHAEMLYNAMEDHRVDVTVGNMLKRVFRFHLPDFTVVGATNKAYLLTRALEQRFTMKIRLSFYSPLDLAKILLALPCPVKADGYGALEVARRSRGTPRIAIANYRLAALYAMSQGVPLTAAVAGEALMHHGIDHAGLNDDDRRYLTALINKAAGGPRGKTALQNMTGFDEGQIDDIEEWLLHLDFVNLTDEGRVATDAAYNHLAQFVPVVQPRAELKGI
jgi:Holliday junction DNA helicase RuvB